MTADLIMSNLPMVLVLLAGLALGVGRFRGHRSAVAITGWLVLLFAEALRLGWIVLFNHYPTERPEWFDGARSAVAGAGPLLGVCGTALLLVAIYQGRSPTVHSGSHEAAKPGSGA